MLSFVKYGQNQKVVPKLWGPADCNSRFGDIRAGELVVGDSTVGELSLSSLKLKLFLLSDSAPVRKRERRQNANRLD